MLEAVVDMDAGEVVAKPEAASQPKTNQNSI